MRILWHSVAPWIKTGYGTQTEIFCRRLKKLLDHDVAISSWAHHSGVMEHKGIRIYPCNSHYGIQEVGHHARHWEADLVITLTDSWVFDSVYMKKIPWAPWLPIDHDPAPPKVVSTLRGGYATPIAYSQFGMEMLLQEGFDPLYTPHACHETYFERTTKSKARKNLGFPGNAYIVGMVGVNQSVPNRKSYPQAICAFREFQKKHKEAFLYMHTAEVTDSGLNLSHLAESIGLPSHSYTFVDKYETLLGHPESYLRDAYTAFDVFLTPNMGEGFGVPVIEAQACGTPIIGTNFSTFPELCHFGELIDAEPFYTNQSSFQRIPNTSSIVKGLNKVYNYSSNEYKKGQGKARRAMKKYYHPDTVTTEHWQKTLTAARLRIGKWDYKKLSDSD